MSFRFLTSVKRHFPTTEERRGMRTGLLVALLIGSIMIDASGQEGGKFSGQMYLDYQYNVERDSTIGFLPNAALNGPKAYHAFLFRRIYFTYDHQLTDDFSTRFRLEADQAALSSDGKISSFVKDAFLRWKSLFGKSELIVGIQPTPAFEISEGLWGYRSLEKTIMDLRGVVGSRDFGLSLRGGIDQGGIFSYWVMVANGAGNRPEGDKHKRFYGHFHIKPVGGVTLTVYGDLATRGDITNPYSTSVPKARVPNSMLTGAAFLAYTGLEALRAGIEAFTQRTSNGFNTGSRLVDQEGVGVSLFASWSAAGSLDLVGRYDFFDPNTHTLSRGDSRGYLLAALVWKADPRVLIMPNIQIETYENSPTGRSFDSSVTARVTVAWQFP